MVRSRFILGSVLLITSAHTAQADAPLRPALTPGIVSGDSSLSRGHAMQPARALSYRETMSAISDQISVLSRLRAWRGTLSGTGQYAQRRWNVGAVGQNKLQVALGAQTLPGFQLANLPASAVGTSVRLGRIAAGSTWRPRDINRLTQEYDAVMTGEAATGGPVDGASWSWLTARPLQSSSGNLDLLHARGTHNGSRRQLTGARGEWNAPRRWKLRGEWTETGAETADAGDSEARAWTLGAAGPVRHPWGEANASAQWQSVRPGYRRWDDSAATPARSSSLALQQNVAVGDITGTLLLSVSQTEPLSEVIARNAALTEEAQNKADLRWKLTSSLSLIARHSHKTTAQRIELTPSETTAIVPDAAAPAPETGGEAAPSAPGMGEDPGGGSAMAPVELAPGEVSPVGSSTVGAPLTVGVPLYESRHDAWQIARERSGEAGLELKLSRSLGVTATAGQTRIARSVAGFDFMQPEAAFVPGEDERNRLALTVQRRTAGGAWSIGLTRQLQAASAQAAASVSPLPIDTAQDSVQLAGERNLGPGLKIKGSLGLASSFAADQLAESRTTRNIEAQWSLGAGRIDVRMGDWNGAKLTGAGAQPDGAREWAARLNLGSASKGNGLGLALEYSQRELQNAAPIPSWRIGVTYK